MDYINRSYKWTNINMERYEQTQDVRFYAYALAESNYQELIKSGVTSSNAMVDSEYKRINFLKETGNGL